MHATATAPTRSITSTVISFGLVNIPVSLYAATEETRIQRKEFTQMGNPVGRKMYDKVTGEDVEYRVLVRPDGEIEADARVRVDELNEQFDLALPEDEDYDTVGGYVTSSFARVPLPGEEVRSDGLLIRVIQTDPRRVRRVLIQRVQ